MRNPLPILAQEVVLTSGGWSKSDCHTSLAVVQTWLWTLSRAFWLFGLHVVHTVFSPNARKYIYTLADELSFLQGTAGFESYDEVIAYNGHNVTWYGIRTTLRLSRI